MSVSRLAPARNIASYAVDLAVALGPTTAFSLTGGMAMHLNRAVATHPGLKAVYCQHEQACVAAAEGYAKAADFRRPGLAVVTAGPASPLSRRAPARPMRSRPFCRQTGTPPR